MAENTSKRIRIIGIDLLKMLSMLLVICVHLYMQGGVLHAEKFGTAGYCLSSLIYSIGLCAVDCFVIVHGYCACKSKFKPSRIIERWTVVVFWSIIISCAVMMVQPDQRSLSEVISMFFPVLRGRYWFFNAFVVLFIFEPVLNHIIATLDENKYRLMLFAIGGIFCFISIASLGNDVLKISGGAEFSWFFMLYLIGGYLRRFCVLEKLKYKNYWNLTICFALAISNVIYKLGIETLTSFVFGQKMYGELLWTNTSPVMLGEAICLFLFFGRLSIMENSLVATVVKCMSPLVFSIYIIHVHPLIFWNPLFVNAFAPLAKFHPLLTTISIIGIAVIIYLVCLLLDGIRSKLFEKLKINQLCDKCGKVILLRVRKILQV